MKRARAYVLIGLLLLLAIWTWTTAATGRRLGEEIAAVERRGEPVDIEQVFRVDVPIAKNAAPSYEAMIRRMGSGLSGHDANVVCKFLDPAERKADPRLWSQARQVISSYKAVTAIAEAASLYPRCQFAVNWRTPECGMDAAWTHATQLKELAQLLSARALLQAQDGDAEAACKSLEIAVRTCEALRDDPGLHAQDIRWHATICVMSALWGVVGEARLNALQARRLDKVLSRIDFVPGSVITMRSERAYGIWEFDLVRKRSAREVSDMFGEPGWEPYLRWLRSIPWRPFLCADEILYLREMESRIRLARLPYREQVRRNSRMSCDIPRYAVLSRFLPPCWQRLMAARDRAATEVASCRVALALEAYRDRFGSYPASLRELRTRLGWPLPNDPFSGRPFGYRRQSARYLLYSVGVNLKDDGGREARPDQDPARVGDIVWGRPPAAPPAAPASTSGPPM